MYMVVNQYADGASYAAEVAPKIEQGFVPLLKQQPGFTGYAMVKTEQGDVIAVTLFEDHSSSAAFRPKVGPWMQANIPSVPEATDRVGGECRTHATIAPQSGGAGKSLYCLVQRVDNLPSADIMRPIAQDVLAQAQKTPGFHGAYYARSDQDKNRGCSVLFFDTKEHAHAAHEANLAILRERQPQVRLSVVGDGQTHVLATA